MVGTMVGFFVAQFQEGCETKKIFKEIASYLEQIHSFQHATVSRIRGIEGTKPRK